MEDVAAVYKIEGTLILDRPAYVAGADTGGVDRVDIHPPFFSKKKIRNVTLFEIENKERKKN